jgi:TolA-binding protein
LHADALLSAARIRDGMKQNEQAAALCERLVKEHPQFVRLDAAYYQWAWALRELNRPVESAKLFERLRKECPQSRFWADATSRLADAAFGARDYATAEKLVGEVLDHKAATAGPDAANHGGHAAQDAVQVRQYAMFLRGQIAAAKADWPKTREAFEAFGKEFPDSRRRPVAEFWIAEAFYRQGDYAAAGPRFDQLAQQVKPPCESWMAMVPLRRAQMLVRQNQWGDAQTMAERIAKDFPGFSQQYEVDYVLGRCLSNAADFEGARNAYSRVIRSPEGAKTETAAMAQWMIGESFFHQKNYEAALREYLRLDSLYAWPTWQAGALLQAGKCYEFLGQGKDAVELYRRIVKNHPDTTFAGEAAKRLAPATR